MLTGLPNRRGFLALAEKSFARASRKRQSISFIMADIDHFKKVNDRHGHEAGDEVLRVVAQRFLDCLRVEDICCRYGGEEFLVMLYDTYVIRAVLVAERLRKSIAGKPISTRGEEIRVAISLGVTEIVVADYAGTRKCHAEIRRAVQVSDAFLYKAKKAGRNRVAANLPEEDEGVA